ncbi:MAG: phosphohydrolase, partial [Tannerella sp.]|nr:phosphohydrolase [Tannerella sp.]
DFLPVSPEEQLICFADKFFSKTKLDREKTVDKVRESLSRHGDDTVTRFNEWCKLFLG